MSAATEDNISLDVFKIKFGTSVQSLGLCQASCLEQFSVHFLFLFLKLFFFPSKTRMLKRCSAAKLQKCSVDDEHFS